MIETQTDRAPHLEPRTNPKAWWMLGAAVSLGLIGSELLNAPWSLNWALWLTLLVLSSAFFLKLEGCGARAWWLWSAALLLVWCNVWRDLGSLRWINGLLSVACLALAATNSRQTNFNLGFFGFLWSCINALSAWLYGWIGFLFKEMPWSGIVMRFDAQKLLPLARGALITLPLLLLFGGLLTSADAAFSALLKKVFVWRLDEGWFWWIFRFALTAALSIGALRITIRETPPAPTLVAPRFGHTETVMVLSALNMLFGAFIFVQFGYFFGGSEQVTTLTGLTFSEYARKGFNELIQVVMLAFPVLIAALHASLEQPKTQRVVRWLSHITLSCLAVMLFSAWQRLGLYRDAYGLTEIRLYTAVFLIWLAAMLVWYAVTALRNRYALFPIGSLVAGLMTIIVLNVFSPAALIVSGNLARVTDQRFDLEYAVNLGADALPAIFGHWSQFGATEQAQLRMKLKDYWASRPSRDWRSFNLSEEHARNLLNSLPKP
jgi:Domain of unknown function (DUF4173)